MVPYLHPRLEGDLQAILQDHELVRQLVAALGSPVNLVLPVQVERNLRSFREVYRRHHLGGQIYYAHKANRSHALARQLAATDAGIDVASLVELQHALGSGFGPRHIMATGPKNREFLWLAARTGVIVNADSAAELAQLAAIVAAHKLPPVRTMTRLSQFDSTGVQPKPRGSRFGTAAGDLSAVWDILDRHPDELEYLGPAYHLDTIGLSDKAAALEGCLRATDDAHRRNLHPSAIDIGGGFGVNYLAEEQQWDAWTTELTRAVLGRRKPLTWNGHGYGLRNEHGTVRGSLAVYPAYRPLAGSQYLDRLLDTVVPSLRRTLGSLLLDMMSDLHIEPGRSLLDQCGAVLVKVVETRERDGETLVRLDCNARDVSLEEHGVLMDPILLRKVDRSVTDAAGVYLLGNLCLEADLLTRRKVFLPDQPRPGDLLAFVNTAGYFMDFSAGDALMQPNARTVAAYRDGGRWRWCLDEQYWPVRTGEERS